MNSWEAAFSRVSRRSLDETIDTLDVEPPFSFLFGSADSEMPGLIAQQVEGRQPPFDIVFDLPGRDVTLVTDTLTCVTKFLHVVQSCRANARRGALTWSVVDAYHAALLGGRAVAATLGVIPYLVSGRSYLVDYRPEFGAPQDRTKFRKTYGRQSEPIMILSPRPAHLEQKDQWRLLARLLRLAIIGIDEAADVQLLIDTASGFPGGLRNAVVYDSLKWLWHTDSSSLAPGTLDPVRISDLLTEVPTGTKFLDGLYVLLQKQFRSLAAKVSLAPGAVPKAIDLEPSPHLLAA